MIFLAVLPRENLSLLLYCYIVTNITCKAENVKPIRSRPRGDEIRKRLPCMGHTGLKCQVLCRSAGTGVVALAHPADVALGMHLSADPRPDLGSTACRSLKGCTFTPTLSVLQTIHPGNRKKDASRCQVAWA